MHPAWIASMNYHKVPENERQAFHDWYCKEFPDGDHAISLAYKEWKESHQ